MAEIIEKALLDTVLGMGVVFAMLILIALIIWSFKFIQVFEQRAAKGKQQTGIPAPVTVPNTSVINIEEEEELVDDSELVAVITAAICASMGDSAPVNGLVVKSIKKANRAAWLRA